MKDPIKLIAPAVRETDMLYAVGAAILVVELALLWDALDKGWLYGILAGIFALSMGWGNWLLYQITKLGRREEKEDGAHHWGDIAHRWHRQAA